MKTTHYVLSAFFIACSVTSSPAGVTTSTSGKEEYTQPTPPADPCAGPISYSNIELLYIYTDFDGRGSDNLHGGGLKIEYSPMERFYLTVSGEYSDADFGNLWMVQGGVGTWIALTDNIHLAADGGVVWTGVKYDDVIGDDTDDDTGWYVHPHLRGKWGCFEAHLGALYRDLGDFNAQGEDGRWAAVGQVYYHLTSSLDLTAGVLYDEDVTQVSGGVRWRF